MLHLLEALLKHSVVRLEEYLLPFLITKILTVKAITLPFIIALTTSPKFL